MKTVLPKGGYIIDGYVDLERDSRFTVRENSPTATRLRPIRSHPHA